MIHSKVVYLCARAYNGKWYFTVSDTKCEGTFVVCEIGLHVHTPVFGILSPESKLFGRLDHAIKEFIDSAIRITQEAISKKKEDIDKQISALEKWVDIAGGMCEKQEMDGFTAVLDEKIYKRDKLSRLHSGDYIKSYKEAKEVIPGALGPLICSKAVEDLSEP